jgi:hypothetical protein
LALTSVDSLLKPAAPSSSSSAVAVTASALETALLTLSQQLSFSVDQKITGPHLNVARVAEISATISSVLEALDRARKIL